VKGNKSLHLPFLRRSIVIPWPSSLRHMILGDGKPSALHVSVIFWFSLTATADCVLSSSRMLGGTVKRAETQGVSECMRERERCCVRHTGVFWTLFSIHAVRTQNTRSRAVFIQGRRSIMWSFIRAPVTPSTPVQPPGSM
jgi:hypothetical protein